MDRTKMVLSSFGLFSALLLSTAAWAEEMQINVKLSGNESVPAIESPGSGEGIITVDENGMISGSVTTSNVPATMAHIHVAPPDTNGPVAIPLEQTDENTWSVPDNTQLTETQLQNLKDGNLYINVHTQANPGGEIRGQLKQ